jgi:hypothetical protein
MTFDDKTRAFMDKIAKKGSVLGLDAMCLLATAHKQDYCNQGREKEEILHNNYSVYV